MNDIIVPTPQNYPSAAQESSKKTFDDFDENAKKIFWAEFDDYFNQNEQTINKAMEAKLQFEGADSKGSSVVDDMNTFLDTVNVVLKVLDVLGQAHPILQAAVSAFHGVISLDIKRRDNNRKVLAVKLQMQTMMCSMFQLRHVRHVHIAEKERQQEHKRLYALIDSIAQDVKSCGSTLNHYQGRSFTAKLVHAASYEQRFAQHVATFSRRRSELQLVLQVYAARGIDAANTSISELVAKVTDMGGNVDLIVAMLRKFDSPQEKDCLKFIKDNGGLKNCISENDLLSTLIDKVPDTERDGFTKPLSREEGLKKARETLNHEMSEDLRESLQQNQSRFEKLLELQTKQMSDYVQHIQNINTDRIINHTTMLHNATLHLANFQDPELQEIWNELGLSTRSVKARKFVLMLRDHLAKGHLVSDGPSAQPREHLTSQYLTSEDALPTLHEATPPENRKEMTLKKNEDYRSWMLKYINVANVQPIVEAIDEDVSGFISIQEVNQFALSRPQGINLLNWIAYWAAGWHINITNYCQKIHATLSKMHSIIPSLRSVNQGLAYIYLNSWNIDVTEATLRSLQPRSLYEPRDARLVKMATEIAAVQEEHLSANLKSMAYLIRTPADILPIVGVERVETWILPLLHLLLKRHLEVLRIGQTKILHTEELSTHSVSLYFALNAFEERMNELQKIFKPIHREPFVQFENFAYGMFHGLNNLNNHAKQPTIFSTRFYSDFFTEDQEESTLDQSEKDLSILAKGVGLPLLVEDLDLCRGFSISSDAPRTSDPAGGNWVGTLFYSKDDNSDFDVPFVTLCLHLDVIDHRVLGERIFSTYKHPTITGSFGDQDLDSGITKINFLIRYPREDSIEVIQELNGEYNHPRDIIKGEWREYYNFDDIDSDSPYISPSRTGVFLLTRSPPHAFPFRDLLHQPIVNDEDTPSKLARRRWAFATQAVIFKVQEQRNTWKFIIARLSERNAWIEAFTKLRPEYIRQVYILDESHKLIMSNYAKLGTKLHPINRHVYDMVAKYLWERKWFAVQVHCDSCLRGIYFGRFICVTCVEEDFSNQLDLCADNSECTSTVVFPERNLVHSVSHTLLRTDRHILNAEKVDLLTHSNLRSERVKQMFREEERKKAGHATRQVIPQMTPEKIKFDMKSLPIALICTICKKSLTLPCWVCAICTQDKFFCLECEVSQTHTRVFQMDVNCDTNDTHFSSHMLLRVHDSAEAKLVRLKSIDKQLQDVQKNMQSHIDKVDTRIEHLSSVVGKFEKRLNSLESTADRLESTIANLGFEVTSLDSKVDNLYSKVDGLEAKMDTMIGLLKDALNSGRGGLGP